MDTTKWNTVRVVHLSSLASATSTSWHTAVSRNNLAQIRAPASPSPAIFATPHNGDVFQCTHVETSGAWCSDSVLTSDRVSSITLRSTLLYCAHLSKDQINRAWDNVHFTVRAGLLLILTRRPESMGLGYRKILGENNIYNKIGIKAGCSVSTNFRLWSPTNATKRPMVAFPSNNSK